MLSVISPRAKHLLTRGYSIKKVIPSTGTLARQRKKGFEFSATHQFSDKVSGYLNYAWEMESIDGEHNWDIRNTLSTSARSLPIRDGIFLLMPSMSAHARNLMRRQACTTLRENSSSPAYRPITVSRRTPPPNSIFTIFSTK